MNLLPTFAKSTKLLDHGDGDGDVGGRVAVRMRQREGLEVERGAWGSRKTGRVK